MEHSGIHHHSHHNHHSHHGHSSHHKKEKVWLGALGAFGFSLIGAIIYFILNAVGLIGSLSGFVAVYCAIYGYIILAKKESKRGIIISLVISAIVITLSWYLCFCLNTVEQINAQASKLPDNLKYIVSFAEFLPKSFNVLVKQPKLIVPLIVSYVFGVLGYFSYANGLFSAKKSEKKQEK